MNFFAAYERYCTYWLTVEEFRRRNFLYKHLFSLPYQWIRMHYAKRVEKLIDEETDFPLLQEQGDPNVVVSLTTFPFRVTSLHLVIKSLLKQDFLPGKIFLCLSEQEFPEKLDSLPAKLKELIPYGLEIDFIPGNIRSHKKYFAAFKKFSDKIVITVDDDLVYQRDTLSCLMKLHKLFPTAVCANRVREILIKNRAFFSYSKWGRPVPAQDTESGMYVAIGYTGVLYPPHVYDDSIFDHETFLRLAPLADDLWLKAIQIKNGVKVATGSGLFIHPVTITNTQKITLRRYNDGQKKNDVQWNQLDQHFGLMKTLHD